MSWANDTEGVGLSSFESTKMKKIAQQNRSPTGWWIASFIERAVWDRKNKSTFSDATDKRTGRWVFEGLTSLLPIYDELEDGAEILWRDHSGRTLKRVRAMVKKKNELEAFDDAADAAE
jgi:hypothetical protein